jgi:hypothetical protein
VCRVSMCALTFRERAVSEFLCSSAMPARHKHREKQACGEE